MIIQLKEKYIYYALIKIIKTRFNFTFFRGEFHSFHTIYKNNSAYLHNNELFFINGLGDVITFNTETNAVNLKFKIDYHVTDGVRYNEQTYFEDDQLYVLRYNEKQEHKYSIETYSLTTGKKLKLLQSKTWIKLLHQLKVVNPFTPTILKYCNQINNKKLCFQ